MARSTPLQTNFSSGEIAPDLDARQDTEQYANGARSLLNRRCLIGGGTKRRPGSWYQAQLSGEAWAVDFIVDQTTNYVLCFGSGRVDAFIRDPDTGELTASGSVTGCDWIGTIWEEMDYEQSGDTAFLTHVDMHPQILTRTGAATWTVTDFSFYTSGPRTEQPYYKTAADSRTLRTNSLTGSVTLTISGSGAHFTADHVGTIVRYLGRETEVTAFAADGLSCTATVLEKLPGTFELTVTSSAAFTVGESVAGATTGARGVVSAIADGTHLTVYLDGDLIEFTTENIVGPHGVTAISAVSATTEAAVEDWDEQLFSPVNGYPKCLALHRNRLCFGGHPAVPNALICSKISNLYSFDVGDASDADGILLTIGDAGASEIVQLHSAEQLLILTDHGPYYVPESVANPFRPTSIAFFPFGSPWPITATAKAHGFDDGVLFCSGSLVVKARPTGDLTRAWDAEEVSLVSNHLISNPSRVAVVSNFAGASDRYALLVNDDGGIAALQLVEKQRIRNVTPWVPGGENDSYISVAAIGGDAYCTTARQIAGERRYYLEYFDQDVTLDLALAYANKTALDADVESVYGSTTINVVVGNRFHLGEWPLSINYALTGTYVAGLFYDSEIETLPPVLDSREGSLAGEKMRICKAWVKVHDSARFSASGSTLSAYQTTDDPGAAPPLKNSWQEFEPPTDWSSEPTLVINQPDPLPLEVLGIKLLVAHR
jgi:hypothetical protein